MAKGPKSDKFWRMALQVAVNRRDEKTGKKYIDLIAQRVVLAALQGDMDAIHEIGDRLDGRTVTIQGDAEKPLTLVARIERVIVEEADWKDVTDTDGPRLPPVN